MSEFRTSVKECKECKVKQNVCRKCGEEGHVIRDCKSKVPKCRECRVKGRKDTGHSTSSAQCPEFQARAKRLRARMIDEKTLCPPKPCMY